MCGRDWSSDVCSSDLLPPPSLHLAPLSPFPSPSLFLLPYPCFSIASHYFSLPFCFFYSLKHFPHCTLTLPPFIYLLPRRLLIPPNDGLWKMQGTQQLYPQDLSFQNWLTQVCLLWHSHLFLSCVFILIDISALCSFGIVFLFSFGKRFIYTS